MPEVNPDILNWARESAGIDPEEAVRRIGLNDAHGVSAVDRLAQLETGEVPPTRAMLQKMADQYHRPLLTFYLAQVPEEVDKGEDFRTLPDEFSRKSEAVLEALLRDVRARQALVREVLIDEDEAVELEMVGSVSMTQGVAHVARSMSETLGCSHEDVWAARDSAEAFNLLREKTEAQGIFVILASNLGSHHTSIPISEFRGYVLADPIAPFVVINDQDSKAAWSFTLLHELAHLWLGQSGVSGNISEVAVEKFCNDVAAQFLLPEETVRAWNVDVTSLNSMIADIEALAGNKNVSLSMVAYALLKQGKVTREQWRALSGAFRQRWLAGRQAQRDRARENDGGPNYYTVRYHRVGSGLTSLVDRMLSGGSITTTKAGKVLGVKPVNVHKLLAMHPTSFQQVG